MGLARSRTLAAGAALVLLLASACDDEESLVPDTWPPDRVTDLVISSCSETSLTLAFTAPGDDGDQGRATALDVRYSAEPDSIAAWWDSAAVRMGDAPSPEEGGQQQELTIKDLDPGIPYWCAVRAEDEAGNWGELSNVAVGRTMCLPRVTSPLDGQVFCAGDSLVVAWQCQMCAGNRVKVELLVDGETCQVLAQDTLNNHALPWRVEPCQLASGGYRIRVTCLETGDAGESEGLFYINPACSPVITHPSGGEELCVNEVVELRWNTSTCCGDLVTLLLLHNDLIVDTLSAATPNDGRYSWRTFQIDGSEGEYKMRIVDQRTLAIDDSDTAFRIMSPAPLCLLSPNGGASYAEDQIVHIHWNLPQCGYGSSVRIDLLQHGLPCAQIATSAPNTGLYSWHARSCTSDSTGYAIRVEDPVLESVDESDSEFTIETACHLRLLSSHRALCEGESVSIMWSASAWCGELVDLYLCLNGTRCRTLAEDLPNDGQFEWVVQRCDALISGYEIELADPSSAASAVSSDPFIIGRTTEIMVDPLGGGDVGTIAEAVAAACGNATVSLADGVYSGAGNRDIALCTKDGITIRSLSGAPERCIIDCGGCGQGLTKTDSGECRLEGLTVRNGIAVKGAAVYLAGQASLTIVNCVFEGGAAQDGGALYIVGNADATLSGCVFRDNRAEDRGGAVYDFATDHSLVLAGCTFYGNSAPLGAGLYVAGCDTRIDNSIIAAGERGNGIVCGSERLPQLSCCDVYGNAGGDWVTCIRSQLGQRGNFSKDPLFRDPGNGDLHLRLNSPCTADSTQCGLVGALGAQR